MAGDQDNHIYLDRDFKESPVDRKYRYKWGESKKTGISKNIAITTLKSIRKGKNWCVFENSAQMLHTDLLCHNINVRGCP